MKKILILILFIVLLGKCSHALTFPIDINNCKTNGDTICLTGWYNQQRSYGLHKAFDIPAVRFTPLRAVEMAEITEVGFEYPKIVNKFWRSGYGNYVVISIYEKVSTVFGEIKRISHSYRYAHCEKIFVKEGDIVNEGQIIAQVGATGCVDVLGKPTLAFHLHFEKRDVYGNKISFAKEFGDVVRKHFGSNNVYTFTLLNNGDKNN